MFHEAWGIQAAKKQAEFNDFLEVIFTKKFLDEKGNTTKLSFLHFAVSVCLSVCLSICLSFSAPLVIYMHAYSCIHDDAWVKDSK